MALRCIIIEDQPPAQRILQKYIADLGNLELTGTFSDAISAMTFLNENDVEIIFLDVHLPKISGMEFLEILKKDTQIILTTAFSEYALKGYEFNVVDYLLKPFSFQRFVKAVSKAETILKAENKGVKTQAENDFIFIKSGHDFIKVLFEEIQYIKSEADYTEIFTNTKKHLTSYPLKFWLEKLNKKQFCQVHKSYILNIQSIQKVSGNQIFIGNNVAIPLGRAYKEYFHENFIKKI
ncbi:LytR/AlgR family response regulator transcription factor [Aureivirga marina]|uniref:LytR/AlgR family response regulator transcription factor n=1 Tax=Aureivirga marina TaxID=1182451 RepID=UPI0018CB29B7|nr:LytTR family transcriptional regulator DNA-binding domain-containing protein [Aureivirga marina]